MHRIRYFADPAGTGISAASRTGSPEFRPDRDLNLKSCLHTAKECQEIKSLMDSQFLFTKATGDCDIFVNNSK
ncbi:unnamed protein product [Brassicogethes aeneus]|uniref:Uncharacterized protein n=1 Tax=Brassicogethes aeneus TaxID=1431903 RepID=A0A9P0B0F7_BRAAE|nr:unnamed protein product [Brassicogethes aeneus]